MAPNLAELKTKRKTLLKKVIRLQTLINDYTAENVDLGMLEIDSESLAKFQKTGEDLFESTYELSANDEEFTRDHEGDFDAIQGCIKTLQIKIMGFIRNIKEQNTAGLSPSFRLDRIPLPKFTGDFSEWQSFRDLFIASVHNNPTLSGAEKLIHLKTCLIGDASSIVSAFKATAANYNEAWDLVNKRFNNNREMIFAHIKKFDDVRPLKEESSSGLRLLSDTINECVRSLKALHVQVDKWDLILIYYALKKLDSASRKEWSMLLNDAVPSMDHFIGYLECRARALADSKPSASSSSSRPSNSSSSSNKKTSSSAAQRQSSSLSCVKCSSHHHLYQCKDFASMSLQDRRNLVQHHRLCFNCMFSGHVSSKCPTKFSCRKCGARHHSLLHEEQSPAQPPVSMSVPVQDSSVTESFSSVSTASASQQNSTVVLLATLLVSARDSNGQEQMCRVFLDPVSETHFI
jgi:hypothetical protein